MLNGRVQDAINNQIQAELNSAYVYLAMSAYCESKNLKGFANWLRLQYQEETQHAMKMYNYILERGGMVSLKAIEAPPAEYGSPVELFRKVLEHEQCITDRVNRLYEIALVEKDFASQVFLQWFINEQVEEEASASEILGKLEMIGDRSGAILYLDKELGKRQ